MHLYFTCMFSLNILQPVRHVNDHTSSNCYWEIVAHNLHKVAFFNCFTAGHTWQWTKVLAGQTESPCTFWFPFRNFSSFFQSLIFNEKTNVKLKPSNFDIKLQENKMGKCPYLICKKMGEYRSCISRDPTVNLWDSSIVWSFGNYRMLFAVRSWQVTWHFSL